MAIWSNDFHNDISQDAYNFNQSILIDRRLLDADLRGSIAHAVMLGKQKIIPKNESKKLVETLEEMRTEYKKGDLEIDKSEEDIHSFIETELTKRLGEIGKKIHTGRSRNDQVAVALKIYIKDEIEKLSGLLVEAIQAFTDQASQNLEVIMPGYTHLQRAQPITYGHYLMSYAEMLYRDLDRLLDVKKRILNTNPLGAGALATTTFPLDRQLTTDLLNFTDYSHNSLDAIADRDYSIELASSLSILAMHLSRYAEEAIIWSSQEFHFIQLDDAISTGSSIMPQKKNADIHELMRGKTGRVYGNLMSILTIMKGLPLAYNKDMQEEKELIFDSIDTMKQMLALLPDMLNATQADEERMYEAAGEGFINATDCADYLTAKGLPFREAYQITGNIIQYCTENKYTLETMPLEEYQNFHSYFDSDIYEMIDLKHCTFKRDVAGGPAPKRVQENIDSLKQRLADFEGNEVG